MKKEMAGEYINAAMAVMAMQTCQMHFAMQGYLVTSRINLSQQECELTVYFNGKQLPKLPTGYSCSSFKLDSHEYYSDVAKKVQRVRTKDYFFTWIEGE